jgi:hypothetical protein
VFSSAAEAWLCGRDTLFDRDDEVDRAGRGHPGINLFDGVEAILIQVPSAVTDHFCITRTIDGSTLRFTQWTRIRPRGIKPAAVLIEDLRHQIAYRHGSLRSRCNGDRWDATGKRLSERHRDMDSSH